MLKNFKWWVTPSGTTVHVDVGAEGPKPNHDALQRAIAVSSTGGFKQTVNVEYDKFLDVSLPASGQQRLSELERGQLSLVATLHAVDTDPGFFENSQQLIVIDASTLPTLRRPEPIAERALRRYIARRLYLVWSQGSFDDHLVFTDVDALLTGHDAQAFLRNLQLLEQEGYVKLERTMGSGFGSFDAAATAELIRSVEQYGAAPDDVESAESLERHLGLYPALRNIADSISLERRRCAEAASPAEISSVFRGIMPTLEGLVRSLLEAHGSKRSLPSLGPMIAELKSRGIGGQALTSQLNAVLTFARDLDLHGQTPPTSVVRIATETCFELFPQLARLFPPT